MAFQDPQLVIGLSRMFEVFFIAFVLAMAATPLLTYFLYKYKAHQQIRENDVSGKESKIFKRLHQQKAHTPTMGGLLVWGTIVFLAGVFWVASQLTSIKFFDDLNFLSRAQTYLPLFVLVSAGILGAFDDLWNILGIGGQKGIKLKWKFVWQILIGVVGAWWFFYKLGISTIHIPAVGSFDIGLFFIPLFIFVIVATTNAVNIADGLDGLAAGILLTCFAAFAGIAFVQGKVELGMFCAAIMGALLAFLWFNIFPARFFMGDTGALSLGATLGVVALLTNSVLVLPIIGLVLVAETGSSLIQMASKKFFKKKVFLIAPLHHHFEAKGWPEPKIVMRFWVISGVFAAIGMIIGIIGRG